MKYFTDCKTAEELKKAYRSWAMKLHPDVGGSTPEFQAMQNEFEKAWERLKNIHVNKDGETYQKATDETAGAFMGIIEKLMKMQGVEVELCGSWLWITGNTKPYKDQLKAIGGRWSHNKNCWYIHNEPYKRHHSRDYSLEEIRDMYGSKRVKAREESDQSPVLQA